MKSQHAVQQDPTIDNNSNATGEICAQLRLALERKNNQASEHELALCSGLSPRAIRTGLIRLMDRGEVFRDESMYIYMPSKMEKSMNYAHTSSVQKTYQEAANLFLRTGIKTHSVRIWPTDAESILSKAPTAQRNCQKRLVARYSKMIAAGQWKHNGETIKIGADGAPYDGQHRLRAVVESKCPIVTEVTFGYNIEEIATVDRGRSRTLVDSAKILFGEDRGHQYAICSQMLSLERGTTKSQVGIDDFSSNEYYIKNKEDVDYVVTEIGYRAYEDGCKAGKAPLNAAFAFMRCMNTNVVDTLARTLVSGTTRGAHDNVIKIRKYISTTSNEGSVNRYIYTAVICSIIFSELEGERVEK